MYPGQQCILMTEDADPLFLKLLLLLNKKSSPVFSSSCITIHGLEMFNSPVNEGYAE